MPQNRHNPTDFERLCISTSRRAAISQPSAGAASTGPMIMIKSSHAPNKMRPVIAAACVIAALLAGSAVANDRPNVTGLFLTTPYPALTVRAGEAATIELAVHN